MKNKILFSLFGFALALPLALGGTKGTHEADEVKASGEAYPVYRINGLSSPVGFAGGAVTITDDGFTTVNGAYSGVVYNYTGNGSYGYTAKYSVGLQADATGLYFSIADHYTKVNGWQDWGNQQGYQVCVTAWGTKARLIKGGTVLQEYDTWIASAVNEIELHIVDVSETASRVIFRANGTEWINYLDEVDPIKPTGLCDNVIWATYGVFTFTNYEFDCPIMPLNTISSPRQYAEGGFVNNGDSITLQGSYSGAIYSYKGSGYYGYTADCGPIAYNNIRFVIADTVEKSWNGADLGKMNGYMVVGLESGSGIKLVKFTDQSTTLASCSWDWVTPFFSTRCLIEFSIKNISANGVGGTKVSFKIDGVEKLRYVANDYVPSATASGHNYSAVFTEGWSSGTVYNQSIAELDTFQDTYLKMNDPSFDGQGSGACKVGLYSDAKAAFQTLSDTSKLVFQLNDGGSYQAAHDRYLAWARANDDATPFEASGISAAGFIGSDDSALAASTVAIIVVAVTSVTLIGLILVAKKRKTAVTK